ncbi:MAG: hypothetical protein MPW15_21720 [Candidatus Manganitrophus sp.]|nr:hypothetical protein [Candidatus Manganitrophus sp.]
MNQASWSIDFSRLSDDPVLFLSAIDVRGFKADPRWLSLSFFLIAIGIPLARRYFSMRHTDKYIQPVKRGQRSGEVE